MNPLDKVVRSTLFWPGWLMDKGAMVDALEQLGDVKGALFSWELSTWPDPDLMVKTYDIDHVAQLVLDTRGSHYGCLALKVFKVKLWAPILLAIHSKKGVSIRILCSKDHFLLPEKMEAPSFLVRTVYLTSFPFLWLLESSIPRVKFQTYTTLQRTHRFLFAFFFLIDSLLL